MAIFSQPINHNQVVNPKGGGKLVMKSIAISVQTCEGIGKGCSNPEGSVVVFFACWQMTHCCMKFFISLFILYQ